jgi:hypothetical protein
MRDVKRRQWAWSAVCAFSRAPTWCLRRALRALPRRHWLRGVGTAARCRYSCDVSVHEVSTGATLWDTPLALVGSALQILAVRLDGPAERSTAKQKQASGHGQLRSELPDMAPVIVGFLL